MIKRDIYLKELNTWKNQKLIKVVTGVRRCGKSTMFQQFIECLKKEKISDSQIININLEDLSYDFDDYKDLYNYICSKIVDDKNYYIFLDEIQNVKNFQKAVDSLYIKKNVDLYITGSNAYLLSGELATLLTGRYIEIKMLPLSFNEFKSAFDDNNEYELFLKYMEYGGMPGLIDISKTHPENVDKYLDGIFSTIVYKDIMLKNNINDKLLLERVLKFIFDNVGNPTSIKKISDTLTSSNYNTSNHTVEKYINSF